MLSSKLWIKSRVQKFRADVPESGLKGYSKIRKAGVRPMYLPKGWKESARWLEKKGKKSNWLGSELNKKCQGGGDEDRWQGSAPYQDIWDSLTVKYPLFLTTSLSSCWRIAGGAANSRVLKACLTDLRMIPCLGWRGVWSYPQVYNGLSVSLLFDMIWPKCLVSCI